MDYPATVRDGSTGQLVNGYWLVELYASVSRKNPVPCGAIAALGPFASVALSSAMAGIICPHLPVAVKR